MANKIPDSITYAQAQNISRQLDLVIILLTSLADEDFKSSGRPAQMALLKKRGFQTKDLIKSFGVSKQAVNAAVAKKKNKK
jgi:hypothetical protein